MKFHMILKLSKAFAKRSLRQAKWQLACNFSNTQRRFKAVIPFLNIKYFHIWAPNA